MPSKLTQDQIVYGALGLFCLGTVLIELPKLQQGLATQQAKTAMLRAQDNEASVAEARFKRGCNTGFLNQAGKTTILDGSQAFDIRNKTPLQDGAVVCDEAGATAIVKGGVMTQVKVSAKVRKAYVANTFRNDNSQYTGAWK